MERKVGEIFECDGKKLQVIEDPLDECKNCYFYGKECSDRRDERGECLLDKRMDGQSVTFKEIGDAEERVIKLTLEKAKEFYKKGGEFRDLALSVYTKDELTRIELPRTWEEFCSKVSKKEVESYIGTDSDILSAPYLYRHPKRDRNVLPSQEAAKAHLALMQLHQLRDCYRQGWKPDFSDKSTKYCVKVKDDYVYLYTSRETSCFLSFQTLDIARCFMENFRDLIIKAGDLV